jgi:xanthine dehydrogenase YagS FAD-binding subunit
MERFGWRVARSVGEAASAASLTLAEAMTKPTERSTIIKAGGIDLLDLMKEGLVAPRTLVSLRGIPGLDGIGEQSDGAVRVGSMTTLATLAGHPLIRQRYPALAEAAGGSASPQIRNVATLGGNLLQRPRCWYFRSAEHHCLRKGGTHCFAIQGENRYHAIFDNRPCAIVHPSTVATVLVALGATLELADATGSARRIELEAFLVPPEGDFTRENALKAREILTAIHLPPFGPGVRMTHLKYSEKTAFDWSLADAAVVLDLTPDGQCRDAAVVLGAAAPVPYRAVAAQKVLLGRRIDEETAREAARSATAHATPLSGNAYKLPLFETLVRRAILAAVADRASQAERLSAR